MGEEARFEIMVDGRYMATYNGESAVFDSYREVAIWLDTRMYSAPCEEKEA